MDENTVTYYGKGEYALTSKNIEKLITNVKTYNETNTWKWALQDCLGINGNGKVGKRFNDIATQLADSEEPKVIELLSAMAEVVEKDESVIVRTFRPTSAEKQARRTEVKEILETISDFSDAEVAKMVKAI